jgi:hypothetical protein
MKMLPRLSEIFGVNVGELLDMPLVGDTSELSEDELGLLRAYRRSRTMPPKLRAALSETLESVINLYIIALYDRKVNTPQAIQPAPLT